MPMRRACSRASATCASAICAAWACSPRFGHRERADVLARPADFVAEAKRRETVAGRQRGRAARSLREVARFRCETVVRGLAAREREEPIGADEVEQRELEPLEGEERERRRRRVREDAPAFAPAKRREGHGGALGRYRSDASDAAGGPSMVGGELLFRFLNVMLLTALVAPLVLWRYRRAVLAGMATKVGTAMPLAPPLGAKPREAAASLAAAAARLAWEARMRRRVFVAVVAALFPPALLLAAHYVVVNGLPLTPAHLSLYARHRDADGGADDRRARAIRFTRSARARRRGAVRLRGDLGRGLDAAAPLLRQGADARPAAQLLQLRRIRRGHAGAAARARGGDRRTARARRRALRLRRPARVRGRAAARRSPHAGARRHVMERRLGARGRDPGRRGSSSRCRSACSPGGG